MTETGLVRLVLISFFFWGLFWSRDHLGDRKFDLDIGSSIYQGFSRILTCWYMSWDINQKIMLVTVLLSVASPLGYDWGMVEIQIDTTVESGSNNYKRAYQRCVYFIRR